MDDISTVATLMATIRGPRRDLRLIHGDADVDTTPERGEAEPPPGEPTILAW